MGFDERHLRPGGVVTVSGWQVKQYRVTVREEPIGEPVLTAAEQFLPKLLPAAAAVDDTPQVAFSVLHKGVDALWLNLYSWVQEAILHCRAANASLAAPTSFSELTEPLIGCVWELPALAHERSAWVRHLLQPRRPDLDAYLADWLPEGPVGRP
ncbi:MAG TPA: hypothetical protein VH969_15665 [Actinophytocola sp.]|jgi:hypothetical protein|uniref:hypothetical protein n=1 Tax=Actinophytocola sp. TaxID=1872138 RepID=UPI002F92759E